MDGEEEEEIKTTLLLIDCQKSFHGGGSLAVPGADEDSERITKLLTSKLASRVLTNIVATMDTHHTLHIAHPGFWVRGDDMTTRPNPFTIISSQEIEEGVWCPNPEMADLSGIVDPKYFRGGRIKDEDGKYTFDLTKYCVDYTRRLETSSKKFQLCIWPEHCLIGTKGHNIVDNVSEALTEWELKTGKTVNYVMKGQNLLTETYSVFQAEVPVSYETAFNRELFHELRSSDYIVVAGEASSHCVNFSVRDLVRKWPADERDKIILLKDCASPVPGFEEAAKNFYQDMEDAGVMQCGAKEALQLILS